MNLLIFIFNSNKLYFNPILIATLCINGKHYSFEMWRFQVFLPQTTCLKMFKKPIVLGDYALIFPISFHFSSQFFPYKF